jgi:hypothetical protein
MMFENNNDSDFTPQQQNELQTFLTENSQSCLSDALPIDDLFDFCYLCSLLDNRTFEDLGKQVLAQNTPVV